MLFLVLASSIGATPLPAFQQYCFDCHGDGAAKGGLDLEQVLAAADPADADAWLAIRTRLRSRDMPPTNFDRPADEDYLRMQEWVEGRIEPLARAAASPGRVGPRRLNNVEYQRIIRDLFDVEIDVADRFPADGVGEGFDTTADVLSLPPLLLEKYFDAAEEVARRAIRDESHPGWEERRIEARDLDVRGRVSDRTGFRWMTSRGAVGSSWSLPRDGTYLIRFGAFGQQAGPDPVRLELRVDGKRKDVVDVPVSQAEAGIYERRIDLREGETSVELVFVNDYYEPDDPDPAQRDRNAAVQWMGVTGPIDRVRPTEFQRNLPAVRAGESNRSHLGRMLAQVLPRVWRRPVEPAEVERLVDLSDETCSVDASMEDRLRVCLTAMLVSPSFLLRTEDEPEGEASRLLHGHEIAVRMASFLWSSTPDRELLRAGFAGELHDRTARLLQTRRMLADPRSRSLAEQFATQWLQIRSLPELTPDPGQFPGVSAELLESMKEETVSFFDEIVRRDRPVWDLLDGDYTYVDAPLADHYGLELERGASEMIRIDLAADRPRGIFGHASMLTATSNPTRTAPVKRGKWILEVLLDDPPPPPPPGIDALPEAEGANEQLGLRELMSLHNSDPACRACHARMDPLGLAMESFDAVGRMRSTDEIGELDLKAELPDGRVFEGVGGLQEVLLGDPAFLRSLARHMLVFALGRPVGFNDEALLLDLVDVLKEDPRMQRLIIEIIESDAFLRRAAPEDAA